MSEAEHKPWRGPAIALLLALALWASHAATLRMMAHEQVAARLFAASSAVATGDIVLAILFVLLRLTLYLAGPGLLLYALSRTIVHIYEVSTTSVR
jgi:hypothetical protein